MDLFQYISFQSTLNFGVGKDHMVPVTLDFNNIFPFKMNYFYTMFPFEIQKYRSTIFTWHDTYRKFEH